MSSLQDKKAVITGGTRGLGLEIARKFVQYGAEICVCGSRAKYVEAAVTELGDRAGGASVDVAVVEQVQQFAGRTKQVYGMLDALVCCAGVYGPKGRFNYSSWSEWQDTIEVNLFGTVHCCREFLPLLKKSPRGKIILMSGGGATKPMPNFTAYAASKAAVVSFGASLAEELRGQIDVNMVAPGALNTRMLDEVLEAGPEKVGEKFYQEAVKQKENGGASIERAAELVSYLASDASNGITGKLVSAVWDDWENFDNYRLELEHTDALTLRRVELKKTHGSISRLPVKMWDTCHER